MSLPSVSLLPIENVRDQGIPLFFLVTSWGNVNKMLVLIINKSSTRSPVLSTVGVKWTVCLLQANGRVVFTLALLASVASI